MPLRACTVTIHDLNDVAHSLDVTAATLYEAVAEALSTLRAHDWVGEIGTGLTEVTVKVRQPEVTHTVRIKDFETWLNRQGKTPPRSSSSPACARCSASRRSRPSLWRGRVHPPATRTHFSLIPNSCPSPADPAADHHHDALGDHDGHAAGVAAGGHHHLSCCSVLLCVFSVPQHGPRARAVNGRPLQESVLAVAPAGDAALVRAAGFSAL
jgi:hypothetical protein